MDITLTIPNDKAETLYQAFKHAYGHELFDDEGEPREATTKEKVAFVKSHIVNFGKNIYHAYQTDTALKTAREGVVADETIVS